MKDNHYFCRCNGGLAQLARALAWHARGHEFDSRILHKKRARFRALFLWRTILPTPSQALRLSREEYDSLSFRAESRNLLSAADLSTPPAASHGMTWTESMRGKPLPYPSMLQEKARSPSSGVASSFALMASRRVPALSSPTKVRTALFIVGQA